MSGPSLICRGDQIPLPPLQLTELRAWRIFGTEIAPLLERVLAAQGDAAEPELVTLQHTLAELRSLGAGPASAALTTDSASS